MCFSVTGRNSQPDPKRAQLPFAKEYRSRRRLANDLHARGKTPSCFQAQIHIFRCYFWPVLCSLPGLSRIIYFYIYFYSCFMNVFSSSLINTNEARPCVSSARQSGNPGADTIQPFPWHHRHGVFLWGVQKHCHPSKTLQIWVTPNTGNMEVSRSLP